MTTMAEVVMPIISDVDNELAEGGNAEILLYH